MTVVVTKTTAFVGSRYERQDDIDLLIEGGVITALGKNLSVGPNCEVIDGSDFFVTPGLLNSHFHPSQQMNRGLAVGVSHADQMDLLHATDRIKEPEDKYWLGLTAMLEALKSGTTCFYSVGSEIESQIKAFQALGVRAACTMIPKDIEAPEKSVNLRPTTWSVSDRLHIAEALYKQYHSDLVRIHFGVCNVRFASDELILGMVKLAEKYDVGFHMHAAEGEEYLNAVLKRTGHRYIEHLHKLNVLSSRVSLAHVTKVSTAEIAMLAQSNTSVVHCPRANAFLAVGTCPVIDLLAAGVNVALGTDAATNNNSNQVIKEAIAAHNIIASRYEKADLIDYLQLFQMLTLNGARAMGLSDKLGTLDLGKRADLVMWSKNDLAFIPGHNFLADLIFNDSCNAHTVFVDGKTVLSNYRPVMIDEKTIVDKAREISNRYHAEFEKYVRQHLGFAANSGALDRGAL
jgi:5-methylthioadenosine/S-adenosylhomocysteine deaminase